MDTRAAVDSFLDSTVERPTLGLIYGRRRIGKSTMLVAATDRRSGFYFEATRGGIPAQLDSLGRELGEHLGVGPLAFNSWSDAIDALVRLGDRRSVPVVLDEFGHILEADPTVDSQLAKAFGPGARRGRTSQARMVLCGSAMALMRALTGGEAPLRGRASLELVMQPDDFRVAATRLTSSDLAVACRTFAVIGGVVGYATDMVGFDLPTSRRDFDRWIIERVLSPAATLHHEAVTLLAEDPTVSGPGAALHHGILSAIANGSVTAGQISGKVGKPVSNLAPALNRLIAAGFVLRHEDPIRAQRPLYALNDPFLQFHYAVLAPHTSLLRDRNPADTWNKRLAATFDSQVRGPVFEEQARTWVRRFSSDTSVSVRDHIGPSSVTVDGTPVELDVVVAGAGETHAQRAVHMIGEAKAGELIRTSHLRRLQAARSALGDRAVDASLALFGTQFDTDVRREADRRSDVEVIDLERLYTGS
ncbi:MAG: winged helix-turn-helix transcriptional regulator [Acidimicrobiia bacterium]|nr:winged helix-turn-helix transcriptional regulator [Acidimicrobiia bacterium]